MPLASQSMLPNTHYGLATCALKNSTALNGTNPCSFGLLPRLLFLAACACPATCWLCCTLSLHYLAFSSPCLFLISLFVCRLLHPINCKYCEFLKEYKKYFWRFGAECTFSWGTEEKYILAPNLKKDKLIFLKKNPTKFGLFCANRSKSTSRSCCNRFVMETHKSVTQKEKVSSVVVTWQSTDRPVHFWSDTFGSSSTKPQIYSSKTGKESPSEPIKFFIRIRRNVISTNFIHMFETFPILCPWNCCLLLHSHMTTKWFPTKNVLKMSHCVIELRWKPFCAEPLRSWNSGAYIIVSCLSQFISMCLYWLSFFCFWILSLTCIVTSEKNAQKNVL